MSTVSDLIHSSMRLIGAIAAGETLETAELNDAFISLNQMIMSWNTEGGSVAGRVRNLIPLAGATSSYTLPSRPLRIDAASASISGIDCPLEIVDAAGWEAIDEKNAIAIKLRKLYCDYLYPNSTVYIWPVPRVAGGTLEIWFYQQIGPFLAITDTIDLPAGYEAGLRWNLALNLAPEYGRPIDPALPPLAQNFKASLVQLNAGNHMKSQAPIAAPQGAAV